MNIAVHGLYRSGTNYLRWLLNTNTNHKILDIDEYNPHFIDKDGVEADYRICIYKSLHQWLDSISRKCYDLECYEDVSWEEGHTKLVSNCGVPNSNITHRTILSLEKLIGLYKLWFDYWMKQDVIWCNYNELYLNPEFFLTKFETNNTKKYYTSTVHSSEDIDHDRLKLQYNNRITCYELEQSVLMELNRIVSTRHEIYQLLQNIESL
jgi:hypothetical protein